MKIPDSIVRKVPLIKEWIDETVRQYAPRAKPLADFRFSRLPAYCSEELLRSTKVVVVDKLPMPPLASWGLTSFRDFENEPFIAITYWDTIFILDKEVRNESALFHDLVHVVQWKYLGEERFIMLYMKGLLEDKYYGSPLEMMAYDHQEEFEGDTPPFELEKKVKEELDDLLKSLKE
jgi:hypothetical protein